MNSIPIKKGKDGNARPIFSGTEDAQDPGAKMCLCGWCEKEIPTDAEVCPFCKRDPRQPGAMAELLERADVIREARSPDDSEPRRKTGLEDSIFFNLLPRSARKSK